MPTQNIKHKMLLDAKRIASTKFKDEKRLVLQEFAWIDKSIVEKETIGRILEEHPEYDGTEFRNMIKKAKEILKEKERQYNER